MRTKNELYQEAMRTVAARRQVARARAEDARAEAEAGTEPPAGSRHPAHSGSRSPRLPREEVPEALLTPDSIALGVPEKLAPLMSANNVTPEELQACGGKRGYFPEDMPIRDYPADFVEGCLVAAWPQVLQMVLGQP